MTGKKPDDPNDEEENNNNDLISGILGSIGKWQLSIGFMMALLKIPVAIFQFNIVMIAAKQDFWCEKWNTPIEDYNNVSQTQLCTSNNILNNCENIEYNRSIFTSTIITEWDLVCSREIYVEVAQITVMFGFLIGCLFGGYFADKFGRKIPLMSGILLQAAGSFVCTFSPYLSLFIVARFFMGLASGCICVVSFVMCIEIVGGKWRAILPILFHIPYGFGLSLISGISYSYRDWRHFHLVVSLILTIFLIFYWKVPESPRWLLVVGQKDKAIDVLKKACKMNGKDPEIVKTIVQSYNYDSVPENTHKPPSSTGLLSRKAVLMTVYLSVQWFIICICYFAFTLSVGKISKDPFITLALTGLMTTPGILLCVYILRNFGRKTIIFWCQLVIGICMLSLPAFPKGKYSADWPRLVIVGIVTFLYSIFLPTIYLHSAELYPTVARNLGIGIVSTMNRVGGMLAPLLLYMTGASDFLPYVIMGCLTIAALLLLIPLPETKDKPLYDTFEQIEKNLSKTSKDLEKCDRKYELVPTGLNK